MSGRRQAIMISVLGALCLAGGLYGLACGSVQRPDGGQGLLPPGTPAPALQGVDQHGNTRSIAEARGKKLLIFFYPKDGTPGCTKQACSLRDSWKQLQGADIVIYGVSADDQESHAAFAKEHRLPFTLIADPEQRWSNAFGVPTLFGMTQRVSFLIDASGKVFATFADVDVATHPQQVLDSLATTTKTRVPQK